jgi:cell division septation protein DedD
MMAPDAAPGTYWQVMAVNGTEAEVVVKALKDKGFPAGMSPGPNNLMRVLVGPYSDTQAMGRAKTDLERAGFHPIRK